MVDLFTIFGKIVTQRAWELDESGRHSQKSASRSFTNKARAHGSCSPKQTLSEITRVRIYFPFGDFDATHAPLFKMHLLWWTVFV